MFMFFMQTDNKILKDIDVKCQIFIAKYFGRQKNATTPDQNNTTNKKKNKNDDRILW